MSPTPFRVPAEVPADTGRCARCNYETARADLVFDLQGAVVCGGCERPVLHPDNRMPALLQLAVGLIAGVPLLYVLWELSSLC